MGDVSEHALTTRRTKVMILATCVAWMAFASVCVVALGVVRGALLGVWGVSLVAIAAAGLRGVVVSWLRAREARLDGDDEKTLDVLAERELQTV